MVRNYILWVHCPFINNSITVPVLAIVTAVGFLIAVAELDVVPQ